MSDKFVCQECGAELESAATLHSFDDCRREWPRLRAENERLRAALNEIAELELEGDASVGDAIVIADEALNPSPA